MNPSYVVTGTVNSAPINVDVANGIGSDVAVYVTLSANYVLANPRPPGFPFRPGMTVTDAGDLDYPLTISSGTRIQVLAAEAAALVGAGAASYS
jgi:hypothetical protein